MNASILPIQRPAPPVTREREAEEARLRPVKDAEQGPRKVEEERQEEPQAVAPVDPEIIESAIEKNGHELVFGGRRIEFNFDRDVSRVIVRVVSADSDEVIRQIPPDDYLKFMARFKEQIGVLFDETA